MEFLLKFPGLRDGRPGSPRRAWLNRSLRPVHCTTLTIGDATPSSPQGLARQLRRSAPRRNLLTYREFIAWRKGDTHARSTSVADRHSHSDHHPALSVQCAVRADGLNLWQRSSTRHGVVTLRPTGRLYSDSSLTSDLCSSSPAVESTAPLGTVTETRRPRSAFS
jgi:hypothetical protein